MNNNENQCWYILTEDRAKADKIMEDIAKEQGINNNDFVYLCDGKNCTVKILVNCFMQMDYI